MPKVTIQPTCPVESLQHQSLRDKIIAALQLVYDPELPVNIYDLGLIYAIDIQEDQQKGASVNLEMTLTAPNCPVADALPQSAAHAVQQIPDVQQCTYKLVWEPKWTQDMMSDAAKLELGIF